MSDRSRVEAQQEATDQAIEIVGFYPSVEAQLNEPSDVARDRARDLRDAMARAGMPLDVVRQLDTFTQRGTDAAAYDAFVQTLRPDLEARRGQLAMSLGNVRDEETAGAIESAIDAVFNPDAAIGAAAEIRQIAEEEDRVLAGQDALNFILNKEQCVLSHLTTTIIEDYFTDAVRNQEHITQVNSDRVGELVGLLNGRPNLQNFFRIENAYLSLMVPKLRLYKQIFDMQDNKLVEDQKIEFKFDSFTRPSTIQNITNSGEGRGGGVGIKKASWSYEGTNPEEITTFVNFDLSLYFQSIQDLLPPGLDYSLGDAQLGREIFYDNQDANLIQLIAAGSGGNTSLNNQRNPMYFTVKAQVGWELSDDISMNLTSEQISYIRSVVNSTDVWLELSMLEHSVNINDDGSITLDIRYVAGLDEQLSDDSMNILRVGLPDEGQTAIDNILDAQGIDQETAQAELHGSDGPDTDDTPANRDTSGCRRQRTRRATITHSDGTTEETTLSERQQAVAAAVTAGADSPQNIYNNYETFFNNLLDQGKVYEVTLDKSVIGDVLTGYDAPAEGEEEEDTESRVEEFELLIEYLAVGQLENMQLTSVQQISSGFHREQPLGLDGIAEEVKENLPDADAPTSDILEATAGVVEEATDAINVELLSIMSNDDPYYRIQFIRLGDLLDTVIGGLKDQEGNPLSVRDEGSFNFISGIFTYFDVHGNRMGINYCDILISLSKFREFFVEEIIKPLRVVYNLRNFIISVVSKFSYVASITTCTQGTFVRQDSRPSFSVFQSPRSVDFQDVARLAATREEAAQQSEGIARASWASALAPVDQGLRTIARENIVNDLEALSTAVQGATGDASERSAYASGANIANYFVIQSTNFAVSSPLVNQDDLAARERADAVRGIYHIRLGSDRGLLKNISFIKDELAGRREGRIVRGGGFNASVLREKYNADLTLYGCPFIHPGMYIYIDPSMIGMGFTDRAGSAAQLLGLGGYYFVNKVTNSISSEGTYETQLETIWNSFGGGRCSPQIIVSNVTRGQGQLNTNVPGAHEPAAPSVEETAAEAAGGRHIPATPAGGPVFIPGGGQQF